MKVLVFRDEQALMLLREVPDRQVCGPAGAEFSDVQRAWEHAFQQRLQLFGQLLVEEEPYYSSRRNAVGSSLTFGRIGEARSHTG